MLTESYVKRLSNELPARIFNNIAIKGPEECWEWQRSTDGKGYGMAQVGTHYAPRAERVHRIVYRAIFGPIVKPVVMHTCDNRTCVNPQHLVNGTRMDNTEDASRKGRLGKAPKISDAQVAEIRMSKERGVGLAARYGISQGLVSSIRHGYARTRPSALQPRNQS